jgi:hypothetical protein
MYEIGGAKDRPLYEEGTGICRGLWRFFEEREEVLALWSAGR